MTKLYRPSIMTRAELDTPIYISEISAVPLNLPLSEPFHIASDDSKNDGTENVLVQIKSPDGTVGVGEAAPFFGISGDTQELLLSDITKASSLLRGMSANIFEYEEELRRILHFPAARAAVEMALFDILAKQYDLPLARLINPNATMEPVETDITISIMRHQAASARASSYFERKFGRIKIKVGDGVDHAVKRVRAVVESLGDNSKWIHLQILIDANEGFTSEKAIELVDRLDFARHALKIFEQPVKRDDLSGMKFVSEHMLSVGGAVFADESVYSLDQARMIVRLGAATGINLKLMKHGGIIEAVRIAEVARRGGLKVMVGQMIESKIATSAGYHLARAVGVDWCDLDMPMFLSMGGAITGGVVYSGPRIMPPQLMGLGVSIMPIL